MRHGAAKSVKEGSEAGRDFKSVHRSICSLRTLSDGIGGGRGDKEAGWDKPSSAPTLSSPAKAHESGKLFQQLQVSEERKRPEMWKGVEGLQLCHLDLRSVFASVSRSTFIHPSLLLAPCTHLARRPSPVAPGGDDKSATFSSFLPFQMSPKRVSRCV